MLLTQRDKGPVTVRLRRIEKKKGKAPKQAISNNSALPDPAAANQERAPNVDPLSISDLAGVSLVMRFLTVEPGQRALDRWCRAGWIRLYIQSTCTYCVHTTY